MNYVPKNEMIKKNLKRLTFVVATIILATATIFLTKINVGLCSNCFAYLPKILSLFVNISTE